MSGKRRYYLGVDAGGTKTSCLIADAAGAIAGRAEAGPANYQGIGIEAAKEELGAVVEGAIRAAGIGRNEVAVSCYGVAGADRKKDFKAIDGMIAEIDPAEKRLLFNDTIVALRAGTSDGVGVAVVAGTGTNCIGRGRDGQIEKVGGFCFELGDFGSANDIATAGLRAAMRGKDGRGKPTILYDKITKFLNIEALEDIIEFWFPGAFIPLPAGILAPLVFEAANEGDQVATGILVFAGREMGLAAALVIRRLFAEEEKVVLVLGGSVLQKGRNPALVDTLAQTVTELHPAVEVVRLEVEPVLGAVLLAHDEAGAEDDFEAELRGCYAIKYGGRSTEEPQ